jgi:sugar lactone lactonase YvrE
VPGGRDGAAESTIDDDRIQSGSVREIPVVGLRFPEGPRWRDGTWWLSDQLGDRVLRVAPDGTVETVGEVPHPSGLGFLPDGDLVVALMEDARIVRVTAGGVRDLVNLRALAPHLNDLSLDPSGRIYADAYGDPYDRTTHGIVLVAPDSQPRLVAGELAYPNGLAVTADGTTLVVSETFGRRVVAYAITEDGSLSARRVWAEAGRAFFPDGLCLDARGDAWVASYRTGEFLHLREGGEVLDRLAFDGRWAMACALGGDDGRTLLLCTADTSDDDYAAGRAVGHLTTVRVDVEGVGRP